jgi:hypothetical protein
MDGRRLAGDAYGIQVMHTLPDSASFHDSPRRRFFFSVLSGIFQYKKIYQIYYL